MENGINLYLGFAAALTILTVLVHSVLGEHLIFKQWRKMPPNIPRWYAGIIWACWHILSLFGLMIAALFASYAVSFTPMPPALLLIFAALFVVSSLLVAWGTRLRHPAWIVFLVLANLMVFAPA